MKTQLSLEAVGPLFTSYLSTHSDKDFSKILREFLPRITAIAGTFPRDWKEDYIQEGSLGLYNALRSCSPQLPNTELIPYSSRAIRSKMIDFYRSTVKKFLIDVEIFLEDGTNITIKQPCLVGYPTFSYEDGSEINSIENYSPLPEYASTLELAIDLPYLLSNKHLKQLRLTDSEIRVVNLHYKQGYNTTAVSASLHTSVSNASKLISKANTKIKPCLLNYQSN